jgi:site-specific recombinase
MTTEIIANEIGAFFARHPPPADLEVDLLQLRLESLIEAADLSTRLNAWSALLDWARAGEHADQLDDSGLLSSRAVWRWQALLDLLDAAPATRTAVQASFAEVLREAEADNLFGLAGLPTGRGFLGEFGDRLLRRVLPQPPDEHDLALLLNRLYRSRGHVERFARMPHEVFSRLAVVLVASEHADAWAAMRASFADGFRLLAARVQFEGLSQKMRVRSAPGAVSESAFYRLHRASEAAVEAWQAGSPLHEAAERWRRCMADCRTATQQIERRLDQGVSIDVVYTLEVLDRCLVRMDLMLTIMENDDAGMRHAALHQLLSLLIAATHSDRSMGQLVTNNMRLLQRKIVERAGRTGEHYIAWTRREYWHIWLAAAGGGFLTIFTAAIKMKIGGLHAPLFVEGMLAGINYAVSFLLLQALGLILATKQPAMTAAALASIMRDHKGAERLDEVVTHAAQIVRSQIAAVLGNIVIVSIGAYALSALWQLVLGHPFLGHEQADHVFETLSPITSLTIWYAALTGAILWAASLIGGWFDNWAALHRLPQAISAHRLGQRFGRQRMVKLGGIVSRNIAGWGTNVSLGLMLGLTPAIGAFLGLPLDVRHVTLNTGTLSLATAAMGEHWYGGFFLWALVGIGTMFVLNLGVSFTLSLYTAARAFGLPRGFLWDFAGALGRRLLLRPGQFFLPPGKNDEAPGGQEDH